MLCFGVAVETKASGSVRRVEVRQVGLRLSCDTCFARWAYGSSWSWRVHFPGAALLNVCCPEKQAVLCMFVGRPVEQSVFTVCCSMEHGCVCGRVLMGGNTIHTQMTKLYVSRELFIPGSHCADHGTMPPIVESGRGQEDGRSFRALTAVIVLPRGKRDRRSRTNWGRGSAAALR